MRLYHLSDQQKFTCEEVDYEVFLEDNIWYRDGKEWFEYYIDDSEVSIIKPFYFKTKAFLKAKLKLVETYEFMSEREAEGLIYQLVDPADVDMRDLVAQAQFEAALESGADGVKLADDDDDTYYLINNKFLDGKEGKPY